MKKKINQHLKFRLLHDLVPVINVYLTQLSSRPNKFAPIKVIKSLLIPSHVGLSSILS